MATKRLEYIDALRGFTMILVVFAHIINYGYHITDAKAETMDTFNNLFIRFRMPLFFFISGFVLYLKSATTRLYDTEAKIICIVSKKGAQCIECHHKDI